MKISLVLEKSYNNKLFKSAKLNKVCIDQAATVSFVCDYTL